MRRPIISAWFIVAGSLLCVQPVRCSAIYNVAIDKGPLNGPGTFYLELDGSVVGDGNSTALISGTRLIGGSLGSVLDPNFGNTTGMLPGIVSLQDCPQSLEGLADFAGEFVSAVYNLLAVEASGHSSISYSGLAANVSPVSTGSQVSEPMSMNLIGAGLIAIGWVRSRRR